MIKSIRKTGYLLVFLWMIPLSGQAQVFAPNFECLFSDTLFWQPVANSCGPFVSTDIYFSNNPSGPFTLLTSITDPLISQYFHINTTGEDRYYFLQNNYNCPGELTLSSDTISNLPLINSPIIAASVENGLVNLSWMPSGSTQVSGYIIFRITPGGTIPIDTVIGVNNTNYIDLGSTPDINSEGYFVIAIDPCNNTSNFPNSHRTIFLDGISEECDEEIRLSWRPYQGWENDIESQQVFFSVEGAAYQSPGTISGTDSSFLLSNIVSGLDYCIYVEARESNTGSLVKSNVLCITPDIVNPVTVLQLENLSVRSDNTVELTWFWEQNIEINSYEFRTGLSPDNLLTNFSGLPGVIVGNESTRVDPTIDASLGKTYYRITTIDDCGREFSSNLGSTIFLSGIAAENLSNQLSWTDLDIEGAELLEYHLWKTISSGAQEIMLDNVLVTNFDDVADPSDPSQAEICYFVEADFRITQPDGTNKTFTARSNELCIRQESNIFVPNAFAPAGRNSLFKPLLVFDDGISFQMKIYDRWGALLYETDNYLIGWDGRKGLQEMPMGGYLYSIKVVQPDGHIQERSGPFLLIR